MTKERLGKEFLDDFLAFKSEWDKEVSGSINRFTIFYSTKKGKLRCQKQLQKPKLHQNLRRKLTISQVEHQVWDSKG